MAQNSTDSSIFPLKFIDAHVHGFPNRLFDAVWEFFRSHYWEIKYPLYSDEIVTYLIERGALYFPLLNYAHKSELSREMNRWSYDFGNKNKNVISFGTIHPEDSYFEEEIEYILSPKGLNLVGLKLQILVTDFNPGIRKLDLMYETLIKYNKILVMHIGTGPGRNKHVGFKNIRPVLERYPNLKLQIPHLGSYENKRFFNLIKDYPLIKFDTAMMLVGHGLFPDELIRAGLDDLVEIQDHIMFGSDFPNIPYSYDKSIKSILDLPQPITKEIKDKILYKNAIKFYNLN